MGRHWANVRSGSAVAAVIEEILQTLTMNIIGGNYAAVWTAAVPGVHVMTLEFWSSPNEAVWTLQQTYPGVSVAPLEYTSEDNMPVGNWYKVKALVDSGQVLESSAVWFE